MQINISKEKAKLNDGQANLTVKLLRMIERAKGSVEPEPRGEIPICHRLALRH